MLGFRARDAFRLRNFEEGVKLLGPESQYVEWLKQNGTPSDDIDNIRLANVDVVYLKQLRGIKEEEAAEASAAAGKLRAARWTAGSRGRYS